MENCLNYLQFAAIVQLIDLNAGPTLIGFESSEDNKGFKHPSIDLSQEHEKAFSLELKTMFGRVREQVDIEAQ